MVEYSYSKIKIINDEGITFNDGTKILFEECRCNWAKEKELDDTHCVAERNMSASKPYFIFYSNKKVKIIFDSVFFLCKNKKNFMNLQIKLNRLGYSSYDLS